MKYSQNRIMPPLEDLTLLNRFMFSEAVEDQQFFEDLLSIIIGEEILLKGPPQSEKEVRNKQELRKFVRLDVWAEDMQDEVYNAEVQGKDTKNLPKRGRYYQSLIDSKLLEVGDTHYERLKPVHMITIAPFDLFGQGRYMYTFQMQCIEVPGLLLGDEASRIYLNTKGKDEENISPELKALMELFEDPSEEVADRSKSERIKRMQQHVKSLKANAEVGVRYMNAWEEKALERAEGLAEGLVEGEERMAKLCSLLMAENRIDDMKEALVNLEHRQKLYEELHI